MMDACHENGTTDIHALRGRPGDLRPGKYDVFDRYRHHMFPTPGGNGLFHPSAGTRVSTRIDAQAVMNTYRTSGMLLSAIAALGLLPNPARARLSDEDIGKKREGWYVTALPIANYTEDTGYGYGSRVYLHDNGTRDDLRFGETPYLAEYYVQYFATTRGWQYHGIGANLPRIGGTQYRLQFKAHYDRNINRNYFGADARSLARLPGGTFTGDERELDAQEPAGAGSTNGWYNKCILTRPNIILQAEREWPARVKTMLGIFIQKTTVRAYDGRMVPASGTEKFQGNTRLTRDNPVGVAGGWVNLLRAGVAWDTRDYDLAPRNGWFADVSGEFCSPALASDYRFTRETVTVRRYQPVCKSLLAAARATVSTVQGDPPFFETSSLTFMDVRRGGLGGIWTLRGYCDNRFTGNTVSLANIELRANVLETTPFPRQTLLFTPVLFVDCGRVYDRFCDLGLHDWKESYGASMRIAWNQATILNLTVGASREDVNFFVDVGHTY
jgi:hypothetical protein